MPVDDLYTHAAPRELVGEHQPGRAGAGFAAEALPEPVRVPAGHTVMLESVGVGEITYECRENKEKPGAFAWAFVVPVAVLNDMQNKPIGKYYGGPTWEANDGSKVTGKQVAVAPASPGNIPLQLVKAEPAMGKGAKQQVGYQAKYVFFKQN